ncbi:MAG: MFS transporter [Christensenellaceae bacterium]|jgi:Na+/melibiose symporter-like transporter|nr:MFS transporter [Christensenellaceae bacterium]
MKTNEKTRKFFKIAGYGAADYMGGSANQIIGLYYFVFLTLVAGLTPLLAGIVAGIGRIWDGLIDPAMGVIVDRTRKKMGTVKFLMLLSLIPIAIAYLLFWTSFDLPNATSKAVYFVFAYMLWSTSFSLATVPYDSLLAKIEPEYRARTTYTVSRMIFSGIGGVSATWLYDLFVRVPEGEQLSPALSSSFSMMALCSGLLFAGFVLITALTVKEPPPLPNLKARERITVASIFKDYANVLKCKTYRKFFGLVLSGAFISGAILAAMILFTLLVYGDITDFLFGFSLRMIVVNLKGAIEIGFFVPNLLMMRKYNKHRPYLIDIPMLIAAGVIILFINNDTPIWLFLVAMGLLGGGVSCLGFVPSALLPDLADAQELITGQRNEGVNAGLNTFGRQIVGGLSALVFGVIIAAFGVSTIDYVEPSDATPSLMWAVKMMLAVVPILMCAVILFFSMTYKLDGKAHGLIKRLINERRTNGSISPTEEEKKILVSVTGMDYDSLWISTVETVEDASVDNKV